MRIVIAASPSSRPERNEESSWTTGDSETPWEIGQQHLLFRKQRCYDHETKTRREAHHLAVGDTTPLARRIHHVVTQLCFSCLDPEQSHNPHPDTCRDKKRMRGCQTPSTERMHRYPSARRSGLCTWHERTPEEFQKILFDLILRIQIRIPRELVRTTSHPTQSDMK